MSALMREQQLLPRAVEVTNTVARTFALAIRWLPADVRDDVYLLYYVCRLLDDLVDHAAPHAQDRVEAVHAWACTASPRGVEAEIFAYLFSRHPHLQRFAVADFCTGQIDELNRVSIETEADLDLHAYRVAGTVGLLMAGMLGVRSVEAYDAAKALGIAMQRTNILRDIDEDLERGRVYLPAQSLAAAGISDLLCDRRDGLLRAQIAIADGWYDLGLAGIGLLLRGGRPVHAAALMYREILRELERAGLGRHRPQRVAVSTRRKLWLMAQAVAR